MLIYVAIIVSFLYFYKYGIIERLKYLEKNSFLCFIFFYVNLRKLTSEVKSEST